MALQCGGVDDPFWPCRAENLVDGLEIDGGEGADVETHFLEGCGIEFLGFGGDWRLLTEDNLAGCGEVCGEESPVHVSAVTQIRVIGFLSSPFEDFGDEVLALGGPLDEEFDGGGEEGELYFDGLVGEGEEEFFEEGIAVFDPVRIVSDDPDHGRFSFGLVDRVEVLAERADDGFVFVWVFAEDVADYDCGFLHDVGYFGRDEL